MYLRKHVHTYNSVMHNHALPSLSTDSQFIMYPNLFESNLPATTQPMPLTPVTQNSDRIHPGPPLTLPFPISPIKV